MKFAAIVVMLLCCSGLRCAIAKPQILEFEHVLQSKLELDPSTKVPVKISGLCGASSCCIQDVTSRTNGNFGDVGSVVAIPAAPSSEVKSQRTSGINAVLRALTAPSPAALEETHLSGDAVTKSLIVTLSQDQQARKHFPSFVQDQDIYLLKVKNVERTNLVCVVRVLANQTLLGVELGGQIRAVPEHEFERWPHISLNVALSKNK